MFYHGTMGITRFLYQFFQTLIYVAPGILLAITFHEFAHGYVAYRLGDLTAKMDGRLSFNPFRHLDPWGTLCLLVFHVGWAKPIRVNTRNFKNPRRDLVLVAAAGPVSNFLLAFFLMLIHGLIYKFSHGGILMNYLFTFTAYAAILSIGLGVFNLIPIPPLDGANIVRELWPATEKFYFTIRRYSFFVMMLLLVTGVLSIPLSFLNNAITDGLWSFVKFILRIGIATRTGSGVVI